MITSGGYRVFPTPEGNCRGLFVYGKSAASFEVRELMGGKSSVAFSYRIFLPHRWTAQGHYETPPLREDRHGNARAAITQADVGALVAGLEQEARKRAPRGARKLGRSRPTEHWSRRAAKQ